MITDNEKDQKLERNIINAVKARGLQESMNRWAKVNSKVSPKISTINIILISVAASVLILIMVNILIKPLSYKSNEEQPQHILYSKTDNNADTVNYGKSNQGAFTKTSENKSECKSDIILPNFVLNKYTRLHTSDSVSIYLQKAENSWNTSDYYRTKLYAAKAINRLQFTKSLDHQQQEKSDYAYIYITLALIYMQSPEYSEETIDKLEELSNLPYPECQQLKCILKLIRGNN